ncbi:Mitochondrial inner membrane organizing system component [Cryptotrichosporon argae]
MSSQEEARPTVPGSDCLACRLTGAGTMAGVGTYALYTAAQQGAFARVRPRGAPLAAGKVTAALGVVFLGLGVGRLVL